MAVLVEGISVIVRRDSITEKYKGGWTEFCKGLPLAPFCYDEEIACVGFMTPSDVEAYTNNLESRGLAFLEYGIAKDIAVVDQLSGFTTPCNWLEFTQIKYQEEGNISVCWVFEGPRLYGGIHMKGRKMDVALPPGWEYDTSLSKSHNFISADQMEERLEYLRTEGSLDYFRDKESGQEVFVDRSYKNKEIFPLAMKKLEKIAREAIGLESEGERAAAMEDDDALQKVYYRLAYHLLPQAQEIMENTGDQSAFPVFVVGLIQNIMGEYANAEETLKKAYSIQSDNHSILLELTRCSLELEKSSQALSYAKQAVEIEPLDAASWGNLAASHIQCGNKEEALEAIDRAVQLDPNDQKNIYMKNNIEGYFKNR